MSEWQPISTAPMDGSAVLLWPWDGMVASDARMGSWNGYSWDDGDFFDDMGEMTHWMPLPDPPGEAVSIREFGLPGGGSARIVTEAAPDRSDQTG